MSTTIDPDISVIIPCNGRLTLLERALRSARRQTWPSTEIIVVGDGPQPEARKVVTQCADPNIRYLELPDSRGASAARNAGFQQACGSFIAFLDDDDEWAPTKLERQLTTLQNADPDTGVVYTRYALQSANERIEPWLPDPTSLSPLSFMENTAFGVSVPLIRRTCMEETGAFDETLPGCQDKDLWIRLAARYRFAWVPDILTTIHVHGEQITANLKSKIRARELILHKHGNLLIGHPVTEAKLVARLGMLHCADGGFEEGRRLLIRARELDPQQPDAQTHLQWLKDDPAAYRRKLLAEHFRTMDGITLYY